MNTFGNEEISRKKSGRSNKMLFLKNFAVVNNYPPPIVHTTKYCLCTKLKKKKREKRGLFGEEKNPPRFYYFVRSTTYTLFLAFLLLLLSSLWYTKLAFKALFYFSSYRNLLVGKSQGYSTSWRRKDVPHLLPTSCRFLCRRKK